MQDLECYYGDNITTIEQRLYNFLSKEHIQVVNVLERCVGA